MSSVLVVILDRIVADRTSRNPKKSILFQHCSGSVLSKRYWIHPMDHPLVQRTEAAPLFRLISFGLGIVSSPWKRDSVSFAVSVVSIASMHEASSNTWTWMHCPVRCETPHLCYLVERFHFCHHCPDPRSFPSGNEHGTHGHLIVSSNVSE